MHIIKTDEGLVFHLGRPPLLTTTTETNTVDKLDGSLMKNLKEVEKEEERERRRKFEELHPDEADE